MNVSLSNALAAPGLSHVVTLSLVCEKCSAKSPCAVRGVAVMGDLEPLGDLHCTECGGWRLRFDPATRTQIEATAARLLASSKPLPKHENAFFRGGDFVWGDEEYELPSAL